MADNAQLLIHDLIDSVQQSIDIADQTSQKKYNFALSEMEITMSLQFEIKDDKSQSSATRRNWLSLFSLPRDTKNLTTGSSDDNRSKMTLRMLFKPGGKALVAQGDDGDDTDSDDDS